MTKFAIGAVGLMIGALAFTFLAPPASAGVQPAGDANCDGIVSSLDAVIVLQVDAGLLDRARESLRGAGSTAFRELRRTRERVSGALGAAVKQLKESDSGERLNAALEGRYRIVYAKSRAFAVPSGRERTTRPTGAVSFSSCSLAAASPASDIPGLVGRHSPPISPGLRREL